MTQYVIPENSLSTEQTDLSELKLPAPATLTDAEGYVDYSYINHLVVNGGVIACSFSSWSMAAATESPSRTGQATRIVILSDGHANAGVIGSGELARHAQELLARGVTTSALGIGDGYDEQLLGSIAEAGGGRLLDAEAPGDGVVGEE